MDTSAFKAYDIRGRVPEQLNEDFARQLGRALVKVTGAKRVTVGYDIRLSSPSLAEALMDGICASGADVLNIGLCGTEQVYFATFHEQTDAGVMVTASHNPQDYNGMKLVGKGARPLSADTGLTAIRELMQTTLDDAPTPGRIEEKSVLSDFVQHLLGYIRVDDLKPLKIVVNSGNGGSGLVVDALAPHLPLEFVRVDHEPDGTFPHGVPNPLLPENRARTSEAVRASGADFGVAWDGDYDRCFFFDENGDFIEGYYLVGLLAQQFLLKVPGAKIIHDPRLTWNTIEQVQSAGGVPVQSKTGHAFIKERMRQEDAVYGGEMSAHHYFRDFAYCDSGMIPWLLIAEMISTSGKSLGQWVADRQKAFPASGEINRKIDDPQALLARIEAEYAPSALDIDRTDGISMDFGHWRFNLRMSNTEPLVRLNVESRGDEALMKERTEELLSRM